MYSLLADEPPGSKQLHREDSSHAPSEEYTDVKAKILQIKILYKLCTYILITDILNSGLNVKTACHNNRLLFFLQFPIFVIVIVNENFTAREPTNERRSHQNAAARLILELQPRDHISDALRQFHCRPSTIESNSSCAY